eukprot:gnl/TRDRNA2_/TRDRNA2_163697_c0_seq1.p1 gnl/TRDRNA2_/TRDRNA2_163697_c0~~gnl/TRDRNA2_/TRDRNA2_163697_c0_seq1.p1  ORF type:complete len:552 (+),score=91.90 gnl/TRDRNA2_/TRDRNA2_163697_c0_seq1:3-1658(+)
MQIELLRMQSHSSKAVTAGQNGVGSADIATAHEEQAQATVATAAESPDDHEAAAKLREGWLPVSEEVPPSPSPMLRDGGAGRGSGARGSHAADSHASPRDSPPGHSARTSSPVKQQPTKSPLGSDRNTAKPPQAKARANRSPRGSSANTKPGGFPRYCDPTRSSALHKQRKVFGEMLQRGSGTGGGVVRPNGVGRGGDNSFVGTDGSYCDRASIGGGGGSVSNVSSGSGAGGGYESGLGGRLVNMPLSARGWVEPKSTLGSESPAEAHAGVLAAASTNKKDALRHHFAATSLDEVTLPLDSEPESQEQFDEIDRHEISEIFDSLAQSKGGSNRGDGVNGEDIIHKFHRMLEDQRQHEARLKQAEALVSKLEQQNTVLSMQNFSMRSHGGSTLPHGHPSFLPVAGDHNVGVGVALSGGSVGHGWNMHSASITQPRSPTPSPGADNPPLVVRDVDSSSRVVRHFSGSRPGGGSSVQVAISGSRSRSESPGWRSAWASVVSPSAPAGAGSTVATGSSLTAPLSVAMSPAHPIRRQVLHAAHPTTVQTAPLHPYG